MGCTTSTTTTIISRRACRTPPSTSSIPSGRPSRPRPLADPRSGLTQRQIDLLSVTSPQAYQVDATLYMTGGYGVDTATGLFSTKDALTAIYVPGLMHWVEEVVANETAAQYIRQIFDPIFQVTGGYMTQADTEPDAAHLRPELRGLLRAVVQRRRTPQQVRRFRIEDDGSHPVVLSAGAHSARPQLSAARPEHRARS